MNKQDLLQLKEDIDEQRQEVSRQEGVVEDATNELKNNGVENTEEAQTKISELDKEIEELEKKKGQKTSELEEKLDAIGYNK